MTELEVYEHTKSNKAQILCLSYFDQIIGPNKFYCSEPLIDSVDTPDLGRILEYNEEEGSFIFAFRKYQTINHIFYLDSNFARGGKELIMISYMIRAAYFRNEIADVFKYLDSKKKILEDFAYELKNLDEFTSILNRKKKSVEKDDLLGLASAKFKDHFLKLFQKYFNELTKNFEISTFLDSALNIKKIFIFGARNVGKSSFLKNMEAIQFHNQRNNDLPTRIYNVVIDNMEILTYDCIERDFICEKCKNYGGCIKNAQGFILMINISDKNSIFDAKEILKKILNNCDDIENKITPLLIIGNKFYNKEEINPNKIYSEFNLNELIECGMKIKYYPINIMKEDDKIMKTLRWLIREIV